jgi:hypothetical protein
MGMDHTATCYHSMDHSAIIAFSSLIAGVTKLLNAAYHLTPQGSFGVPPNINFVWFGGLNKEIIAPQGKFLYDVTIF